MISTCEFTGLILWSVLRLVGASHPVRSLVVGAIDAIDAIEPTFEPDMFNLVPINLARLLPIPYVLHPPFLSVYFILTIQIRIPAAPIRSRSTLAFAQRHHFL